MSKEKTFEELLWNMCSQTEYWLRDHISKQKDMLYMQWLLIKTNIHRLQVTHRQVTYIPWSLPVTGGMKQMII